MASPPKSSILLPELVNLSTRADSSKWLQTEISSLHVYQDETLAIGNLFFQISIWCSGLYLPRFPRYSYYRPMTSSKWAFFPAEPIYVCSVSGHFMSIFAAQWGNANKVWGTEDFFFFGSKFESHRMLLTDTPTHGTVGVLRHYAR